MESRYTQRLDTSQRCCEDSKYLIVAKHENFTYHK